MAGSKKCEPGCSCWRHTPERRAALSKALTGRKVPKCEPGCVCKKHETSCTPGCSCSRHRKHPPGCSCGGHGLRGEAAQRMAETQRKQWATKSDEERYAFGDRVSQAMAERGLTSRMEAKRAYHRNHARVQSRRGVATDQLCVICDSSAEQWSQIHGTSGEDPMSDYRAMCRSCHDDYDRDSRSAKVSQSKMGHAVSKESRERMSAAAKRRRRV